MNIRNVIKKIINEEMDEKDEYKVIYSRDYYRTSKDMKTQGYKSPKDMTDDDKEDMRNGY